MNGGRSILPAFGLVDVHSHILPGMDDGARDVAEAVVSAGCAAYVGDAAFLPAEGKPE